MTSFRPGAFSSLDKVGCEQRSRPLSGSRPQASAPLGKRKQHHAAVRGHPTAVERGCDFLALDGWKRKQRNRIVGHGGHGGREVREGLVQPNPTPVQHLKLWSPASKIARRE
jgi:hypothetical protein